VAKSIKLSAQGRELKKSLQILATLGVEKANKVYRAAALETLSNVIIETPVDEGILRNNWQVSILRPERKVINTADKNKGSSYVNSKLPKNILKGGKVGHIKISKVFLTNNLPYAETVEFGLYPDPANSGNNSSGGFSRLAPNGMVRKNIQKFPTILKQLARRG